jgi:6-phosphogluconolactonase
MKITHSYEDITTWFQKNLRHMNDLAGEIHIGLPGGSSLDGWYEYVLAHPETWRGIDLLKLRFGLVDERCLPKGDKDRNDTHVFEAFIWPLCEMWILQPSQFIAPWDIVEAQKYEQEIPFFDIAFFWIGPDWHIASLFPHHAWLSAQGGRYINIEHSPKPPENRISLSVSGVQIPFTCLFAVWSQKKEALASFLDDSVDVMDCPAKLLKPEIVFDNTTEMIPDECEVSPQYQR